VLADFRTAPVGEGLRAVLGLLEKLTLTPDDVSPADVDAARAEGISDEAIQDAMYIAFLFGIYNRVADTLEFAVPEDPGAYRMMAQVLLVVGYR
jgi:alkylhydroperoxidase family enzyme